MSPLVAALTCTLAYTVMNILFKRHTGSGGGALQLTAWLGLLAPIWALALGLGTATHLLTLPESPAYWALSALWAVLLPATTLLMLHLLQTLSLSEVTSARKALVTLMALGVDVLLFHTTFPLPVLLAITVITGAALSLPAPPTVLKSTASRPSLPVRLALLVGLSLLFTLQLWAYKKALTFQPDLLSHIISVKLLAALACLPLFLLPAARPAGSRGPRNLPLLLGVIAAYLVGSVSEGYALQGLPLTILIAATTATAALMAAHDLWRKDLPRTRETAALLALIFAGFALLALAR